MKKQGFTLTEALITIAIIGVAATLIAPMLGDLMPNREKFIFMNAYKELATTTQDFVSSESVYHTEYDTENYRYGMTPICIGLGCVGDEGAGKYKKELENYMKKVRGCTFEVYEESGEADKQGGCYPATGTISDPRQCNYRVEFTINNKNSYSLYVDTYGRIYPKADSLEAEWLKDPFNMKSPRKKEKKEEVEETQE